MEQMCMVDEQGKLADIPQAEREPNEGEYKVPLQGYYEKLNKDRFEDAQWDFGIKDWVGVGEQRPISAPQPLAEERIQQLEDTIMGLMDIIMMGGL